MDTFENQSQAQQQYSPPRKQSPFANSPYESPFTQNAQPYGYTPPAASKKKECSKAKRGISLILVLVIVLISCGITGFAINRHWENEMELMTQVMNNKMNVLQQQIKDAAANSGNNTGSTPVLPENAMTPAQVYAACADTVVLVSGTAQVTSNGQTQSHSYSGSGFVVSTDGYVVTNYHVVEGCNKLYVTTIDGTEYAAKLIGYESANDIALLKAEATDMVYATIGSSSALQVGEQVVAIGNPLGELTSTLTVGFISAKDRIITTEGVAINMLQTDAAINSGNSGGPLFNMYGQVVGITTAKYSGTSTSGASIEGIGFAIPMDDVAGMLEDLQKFGYITGAYLGVMVKDVDSYAQSYGLPAGAYVVEVTKGYAAERAGLKANDIIVNIGGHDITSMSDISRVLRKFKAGDTTTITVYRNGRNVNLSITLDEKPQATASGTVTPDDAPTEGDYNEWYEFFKKFFGID